MKKVICLLFFLCLCFHQKLSAQELKSSFLFELEAELNPPQIIGSGLNGMRIFFPAKSGTIKSEKLNGKILPGGGDWGLVIDSTTFKLDVRVTIQTDDSALIYITYFGFIHTDPKKFKKILEGKLNELSSSDYYFRTTPVFETGASKYAWLNHTVAVGVGSFPVPGRVAYRVYTIN